MIEIQGSSNIKAVDYNPITHQLLIMFKGGSMYRYEPVTATQYQRLLHSESKGTWIDENLKKNKKIICTPLGKKFSTVTMTEVANWPKDVISAQYVGPDIVLNDVQVKDMTEAGGTPVHVSNAIEAEQSVVDKNELKYPKEFFGSASEWLKGKK